MRQYIYIFAYLYIPYIFVFKYFYTPISLYLNIYMGTDLYIPIFTYLGICVLMYFYIHTILFLYINIFVNLYTHIFLYSCTRAINTLTYFTYFCISIFMGSYNDIITYLNGYLFI